MVSLGCGGSGQPYVVRCHCGKDNTFARVKPCRGKIEGLRESNGKSCASQDQVVMLDTCSTLIGCKQKLFITNCGTVPTILS